MTEKIPIAPPTLNLHAALPSPGAGEMTETLLRGDGLRLERIVSHGHASPPGFWYDQAEAEWVLLVSGRARLTIEGEAQDRELGPGDTVFLPAHCQHRVAWTQAGAPTVWLALHAASSLAPEPAV